MTRSPVTDLRTRLSFFDGFNSRAEVSDFVSERAELVKNLVAVTGSRGSGRDGLHEGAPTAHGDEHTLVLELADRRVDRQFSDFVLVGQGLQGRQLVAHSELPVVDLLAQVF